jgi:hypothetical protein
MPWVRFDRLVTQRPGEEAVDVGQVGGEDERRHRIGRQALQSRAAEHRADETVSEIIHAGL